MEGHFVAVFNV